MEGFKVKCFDVTVETGTPEQPESKTMDIVSDVFKIQSRLISGEIKTDFLIYHKETGFIWEDSDNCELIEKQAPKSSKKK